MTEDLISITTPDGTMDVTVYRAISGTLPAVIFYIDAGGVRPAMKEMAQQLAKEGFLVFLPNLYYRHGEFKPFDFKTVFSDPPERDRLFGMLRSLNVAKVNADTGALIGYIFSRGDISGPAYGATGYCMGGRFAFLAAAAFAENFAAVGAFHAGHLVTDKPDSPHLLAGKIRARLYIAPAGTDYQQDPEETHRLKAALDEVKADYTLEVYDGAGHGYAVPDAPTYDAAFADRHWKALVALLRTKLKGV